jgi:hypothetical protein
MKKMIVLSVLIFALLTACTPAAEQNAPPEATSPSPAPTLPPPPSQVTPTQPPSPTETPLPSETPLPPTQTPLPQGILFRDDFEGYLQPGWTWMNEDPQRWSLVEFNQSGMLRIVADKPGNFEDQVNTLMRPLPEGDFAISAHILADPRQNHHQANIFLFENPQNYIRLNFGFCDHCGLPDSGHGYFMETVIENNPFGDLYAVQRNPEDKDVYLRLVNQGGSLTGYYATTPGDWQRIGAFGNYFRFVSVGIGATNSIPPEMNAEDLEALFDYFEITSP